ncbi:hypothetical protein KDN32_18255 [Nocardioides sp. J2M5]|uniref:hypothetical protein n=1 Tax=Nocardioides palaemonis TaxID=2829810 RepID=UPI001BAB2E7A|nr:hypothetical protein [Nocardioides palaemonis]MBS2939687.1 hypothetical protein [Nocardioides palaemonis]
MTLETQLHDHLTTAVRDTAVPAGLAQAALTGGRRRRARRGAALAAVVAAVAVGVSALVPVLGPSADVAPAGPGQDSAGLRWARSLPQGAEPGLPFFAEGGLWADGDVTPVPPEVNRSIAPRPADGGWVVLLGSSEADLAVGLLGPDGNVRTFPRETWDDGLGDAYLAVSPDGRRVATGPWLVDLATMTATRLPHTPRSSAERGYPLARVLGFSDEGLLYEAAPFDGAGTGTPWLLRADGSSIDVSPPAGSAVARGGPLAIEYADSGSDDTCLRTYVLASGAWEPDGDSCMGELVRQSLSISPGGTHLLTVDLPRVWDVRAGAWAEVDLPPAVVASWGEHWMGAVSWEDDDTFLLPVSGSWGTDEVLAGDRDESVQAVRCSVPTGECERAGVAHDVHVTQTWAGDTAVRFTTG